MLETLEDRFAPATVTVQGSTETAIQAAIGDADLGDTVLLPAGNYSVGSTITVNKALTISGPTTGGVATLEGTETLTPSIPWIFSVTASNVTIQDLQITLATSHSESLP